MTADNREFGDDDLRDRFAALRREEEPQAPEFAALLPGMAGRSRRRDGRRILGATALVIIAAAVILWLRPAPPATRQEPGRPAASLTQWRAPTDFLLETPGRDMLRTVPAIGVWQGYIEVPKPGQKHTQVKK